MKAVSTAASSMRHAFGALFEATLIAAIIGTLIFGAASLAGIPPAGADSVFAARGGNGGSGGGGNGGGGGNSAQARYAGTLTATPNVLHAGDFFTVSGCGYDTSLGNVIVGFTGGSWGSPLDENGCFTIPDIPALSGDTLPPGTYGVGAYQYVRDRLTETGETTVTVIE